MLTDTPATSKMTHERPWATFAVLTATAAMTILDVSKVGVALPAIQQSTHGPASEIQFMLVGYTITYALLLLPSGRLGDVLDRKRVFLVGASVFVLASVLCALAPSAGALVGGRLVQGAGAGILMPQVLGIIQSIFPAGQRTRPLAILAAVLTATSTFGPVLAGAVLQLGGGPDAWRILFWINVAVGVVVVPLAWRFIREPPTEKRRGFDLIGAVLLVPAVALTIFPLSTISATTGLQPWMPVTTVAGLAFGALFARHELRLTRNTTQPLVDPQLFRIPHFPPGLIISGLAYASGTASALIVTLSLEQVADQTALQTALWMLPAAAAAIMGSWITARLSQARSYRFIAVGTAIGTVSLLGISFSIGTLPVTVLPLALCLILMLNAFGSALVGAPNQARTLVDVPDFRSSIAGSLIQFFQRVGSAIGLALALVIYYVFQHSLVPWSGRDTLGPTIAIAVNATFVAISMVVALVDRDRPSRPGA